MTHQFTVTFTEEHVRYAARRFYGRYVGKGLPVVFLLMAFMLTQRFFNGRTDWVFGALLAVLIMGIKIFVSVYFFRLNYALSHLKQMGIPTVHYELTEDHLKASSNLGSTELKRASFKALWLFPKVWLLMIDKANYLTLPADTVGNDLKDFLKHKIAAVGGKIN